MGELKDYIKRQSRMTTEKYLRMAFEDVAPMDSPEERGAVERTQKDIDERTKMLLFTATSPEDKEEFARKAKYSNVQFSNLKKQVEKSREKVRTDLDKYSKIKISRINGANKYTDVQLINADRYQKLSHADKWSVFVLYPGSGTGEQSIGMMVRKSMVDDKRKTLGKDSIEGGS